MMQQRGRDPPARERGLLELGWDARLSAMAPSLRQLAPVLAVRKYSTFVFAPLFLRVFNYQAFVKIAAKRAVLNEPIKKTPPKIQK